MKIVEIDIHGFGQLNDIQLRFGAPFVVIYGKNETGKSTLFQFIHTMLFGFSRKKDSTKFLAPVYGGHHGGSLIIETKTHGFVKITRFREQHQGKAQVTMMEWDQSKEKLIPSGQATIMDQSQLDKKYFQNVSSRLFQQVSTISLGELQATSVMSEKELSQYLYHASWESGKYVAELDRELTDRQEKLYKPRGQNQKLTLHIKQFEEIERMYQAVELQLEQFIALEQQLVEIEQSIIDYTNALQEKQQELVLLDGIEHHRELWITQQGINQELQQLQDIALLPASFSSEVESIVQERDALLQERRNVEQKRNDLQHNIDRIHIDEQVTACAPTIKRHAQAMPIITEQQEQLKQRRLELGNIEELLTELQERVPAYFSKERILELHISYEQREAFDRLWTTKKAIITEHAEQQFEYEQVDRQLRKSSQEIERLEQLKRTAQERIGHFIEKKKLIPTNLAELRENRLLLQEAYRQFDYERLNGGIANQSRSSTSRHSRQSASNKQSPRIPFAIAGSVAALLFVICFVLMIGSITIPNQSIIMPFLLICTLAAAIYAVYIKLAQGNNQKHENVERISGDASLMMYRAMSNLIEINKPIELSDYYSFRETLQRDLMTYEEILSEVEEFTISIKQNKQELLTLEAEQHQIALHIEAIQRKLDENNADWSTFQQELGLPVECTYDDFEGMLQIYRTIQHHEASFRAQHQYVQQLEQRIQDYYDELHAIVAMDWKLQWESPDVEQQFIQLQSYAEEVQEQLEERERLQYQLEQVSQLLTEQEPAWSSLEQRQRKLMQLAKAINLEELSYKASQQIQYEQLAKQNRTVDLQRKLGLTEEQLQYIEKLLSEHNLEQLRQYRTMKQNDVEEIREKQKGLLEKKGSLKQQQEGLMSSEEQQRLLLERERLSAQLHDEMMQYVQLGMEKILLQKSKERFEQERQPEVLLQAAEYFKTLTNGAYSHLMNHTGKEALYLRMADGSLIESESLSRGASELLYFCIRMACHDVGMEGRALPLILDDPCVNFDEERLESMLQLLNKVTENRQIIYFTCHPHTVHKIEALHPEVNSITIDKMSLASV